MKIVVVYIFSAAANQQYELYADRFLEHYHKYPPGMQHESVVVLNGCKETAEHHCLFSVLPNLRFLEHDNSGYDIGGFQLAAMRVPCDMMVFFGASTWFRRQGWLIRMATSFTRHGPAQYGAMGNRGDTNVNVWPHIRTTAFWMPPNLMNAYPQRITRPEQRYPFEHGPDCFTQWLKRKGIQSWVVTWTREMLWQDWDSDPEGFHRGRQHSLLAGDHLCEAPFYRNT